MKKVLVGKILKPKGLDGTLKVASYSLGELATKAKSAFIDGKTYRVLRSYGKGDFVFYKLEGIASIDEAEKFRDKQLFVNRDDFNLSSNEFVVDDFIGLDAFAGSKYIGSVEDVQNFGASDIFVIRSNGRLISVPKTPTIVALVDLENKSIVFDEKEFDEVKV